MPHCQRLAAANSPGPRKGSGHPGLQTTVSTGAVSRGRSSGEITNRESYHRVVNPVEWCGNQHQKDDVIPVLCVDQNNPRGPNDPYENPQGCSLGSFRTPSDPFA